MEREFAAFDHKKEQEERERYE
jgi:hypothetical protein